MFVFGIFVFFCFFKKVMPGYFRLFFSSYLVSRGPVFVIWCYISANYPK
uniref:Uncharacterized protein n=1 Tax=Anguilla anguilla TaxID=7936 RepID=A0A0E9PZT1_ANGAN